MDTYEATRIVFQRIQGLDPENASKIMGVLLIQDHGEKEMIRLAFGPEALLHSVILKARKDLGLFSNTPSTPSTPSSPSPFSLSRQNSGSNRLIVGVNLPSPLSIPNQSSPSSSAWVSSSFSDFHRNVPEDLISPTAAAASYGGAVSNGLSNLSVGSSSSTMNSSAPPFYVGGEADFIDEFQLQDQLSFLNDGSPTVGGTKSADLFYQQPDLASSPGGSNGDSMLFPSWGDLPHRRSCSVNDICLGSDDLAGGIGWKPCLYFARGYCKNGTSCRFLHGGGGLTDGSTDGTAVIGSPNKFETMEQCQELLRSKSSQQQRLAAASQLMASANLPYSPVTANKCMNLLLQHQQLQADNHSPRAASTLMMGEEMHKFSRSRVNDFPMNGGPGMVNPGSRQIYLTFPADSTFREEDVSNYFSIYGPVQDVRIPYQQKRMFGFVTFVYPETVKLILAKGNPHFVCDARVLVKPYKEKGKVLEKYRKQQQQQQNERGDFSSGLESRESFDLQLGGRMFYNTQDILWRRKLEEQADLQQALELQSRRLMNLQLLDVKRHHHHHHHQHHRALSTGAAISSPTPPHSPNFFNQPFVFPSDRSSSDSPKVENGSIGETDEKLQQQQLSVNVNEKVIESSSSSSSSSSAVSPDKNGNGQESSPHKEEESNSHESLEHNLPDSPFASPKAAGGYTNAFAGEAEKNLIAMPPPPPPPSAANNNNLISASLLPASSTLDMASLKSCYFQVPRLSSGHGTIGM